MKKVIKSYFWVVFGNLLYAIGMNIFIVPLGLYSGGLFGICQLIRTGLEYIWNFGNIDIAGILYFISNIPLLILSYKWLGKKFFISSLVSIIVVNIFLTFITINQVIIAEPLTGCIIGGLLAGAGSGMVLRAGSSGGGTEIIGNYFIKKNKNISIGKLNIFLNFIVYGICAIVFNINIAIYSVIYSVVASIALDKFHEQNIKVNALIFTDNYEITKEIGQKLVRGSTSWEGKGDYTGNKKYIISTVVSQYELNELKIIIKIVDPSAFVIINHNIETVGYVEKRLDY